MSDSTEIFCKIFETSEKIEAIKKEFLEMLNPYPFLLEICETGTYLSLEFIRENPVKTMEDFFKNNKLKSIINTIPMNQSNYEKIFVNSSDNIFIHISSLSKEYLESDLIKSLLGDDKNFGIPKEILDKGYKELFDFAEEEIQ